VHEPIDDLQRARRHVERDGAAAGDQSQVRGATDRFRQEEEARDFARGVSDEVHKTVGARLLLFGLIGCGEECVRDRGLALFRFGGNSHEQIDALGVIPGTVRHEFKLKHNPTS